MPSAVTWTAAVLAAGVGIVSLLLFVVYPLGGGPGRGREVELELSGHESPDELASKLEGAGLVGNATFFAVYTRFAGAHVAAGPHLLADDLSPRELALRIERSSMAAHVRVTIPEGWTRFDVAKRLQAQKVCAQKAFLDATTQRKLLSELQIAGESADGFLFPATYDFPTDAAPMEVVRRMKQEFDKRFATLSERHAAGFRELGQTLGWGQREVVVLASMVEKEAAQDEERPIIASVFLNRLRDESFRPKLLQCDPTAGYGCLAAPAEAPSCASYNGKVTHDIVADAQNRYNTYKHEGLPPGPIANPGSKSLEAVLAPATTRYFYFVAAGGGRHTFSETYAAHGAAIRGGKK